MAFIRHIKRHLGDIWSKEEATSADEILPEQGLDLYPQMGHGGLGSRDDDSAEAILSRPPVSLDIANEPHVLRVSGKNNQEGVVGDLLEHSRLQAYSHGLENIYAIQDVDLSTVRRMGSGERAPRQEEAPAPPDVVWDDGPTSQMEMDLGSEYRGWMSSLCLSEPVSVLGLPPQVEKSFAADGRAVLGDIVNLSQDDMIGMGIGQGHIDEVRKRLSEHLKGTSLHYCRHVDFVSLLRCLLADGDRKAVHLSLEGYGMAHLFPLTPVHSMELRRLGADQRTQLREESLLSVATEARCRRLDEMLGEIVGVFIRPWVRRRGGLATTDEIRERMQRISVDVAATDKALAYFSGTFFAGAFPLAHHLVQLEGDLFASDQHTADLFGEFVEGVSSYFYSPQVAYPLQELLGNIARESSLRWKAFPDDLVLKALKLSRRYRLRKGDDGALYIKKAWYTV